MDIPFRGRWTGRRWWAAGRAGKDPSGLRITRCSQLVFQTCIQLVAMLCNWEVVKVAGLVAAGNQQAAGLHSTTSQQAAARAIDAKVIWQEVQ